MRDADIAAGDRSRYEHECLSRILEIGVCFDQLCVCNLASFEVLVRRLQLLEHAHLECPSAPDYSGSMHFMGLQERRGGALIAPTLTSHVSTKLKEETAVAKERRKAAELRGEQRVLHPKGKPEGKETPPYGWRPGGGGSSRDR